MGIKAAQLNKLTPFCVLFTKRYDYSQAMPFSGR